MQSSLEPVQTLRCHDPLDVGAIGVPGLHSLARPRLNKSLSKRKSSDFLLEAPQRLRLKGTRKPGASPREYPLPESLVQFTILDRGSKTAFEFSLDAQWGYRGVKRCRLGSDVEGPNTANVGRKKRRLRTRLITSRLSQPFSQPATHILNREGRQVGDRRFVKMAVMLDASRRAAYLRTTAYLRYAIMNRMRKRLGIVRDQGSTKEGEDSTVRQSIDTFTKAPWQSQGEKSSPEGVLGPSKEAAPASRESKEDTVIQPADTLGKAPACRLSKPIALPLPSADVDATSDRTSARIDSTTSPEPRPPLAWMYDDVEEDSFAFLHADEEHLDDDDADVYCDFDAIFAAKATSPGSQSPSEEHTYEEYIDELDGISWRVG
ncbi:hypothetical protein V8C35DRAFT_262509 [Trichoderma chlorosporum]